MSIVLTGCGYGFGKFGAKNIDAKVRKVRNVNTGTKNRIHLAGRLEKSKFGASLVNPLAHWKSKPAINFFYVDSQTVKSNFMEVLKALTHWTRNYGGILPVSYQVIVFVVGAILF